MAKPYLNCLSREAAERLWFNRLTEMDFFRHIPAELVDVAEAGGRVSARCEYAKQSVPHYNSAAMDGIAVYAHDSFGATETCPKRLRILPHGYPFKPGGCYIVDTGDPLPEGTNAVIMREDIYITDNQAEITAAAAPWQHVRIIGEDIVAKELVLPEHRLIAPVDIAALMAAGLTTVDVLVRPRVTVIPTGTELVARQQDLLPGKILDVNSHMLCAAVKEWGGIAIHHPIVPDDYELLKEALQASLASSDIVITNAGTSAGTEDFTASALAELGEVLVHGVAIKPGKPVILAICQGKPVIGLPGYPVSAMLTAELFVKPVIRARQKLPSLPEQRIKAVLSKQTYSQIGTEEYIRVSLGRIHGKTIAAPLGRGAGVMTSLVKADGVVSINAVTDGLPAGAQAEVRLLRTEVSDQALLAIGSHDLALDILAVHLKRRFDMKLSCANVGSMGGVTAIRNQEAHIAGIHLLDPKTGDYNISYVRRYLKSGPWCLVTLAYREQGLMVAAGNPKTIRSLADLTREDIVFVNRQRGSGTRMLLDYELDRNGWCFEQIQGYDKEVGTHMAVGASIAAGAADAGLGVRAAAQALGLEFIPVGRERYDLLMAFSADDEITRQIIEIVSSSEFRSEVEALGGYDLTDAGLIRAEGDDCGC
jgi:putative molybdopterin biosynthesis protein